MDYERFKEALVDGISGAVAEEVVTNGDLLIVKMKEGNVHPTINMRNLWKDTKGDKIDLIRILSSLKKAAINAPAINREEILDWDKAKNNLFVTIESCANVPEDVISIPFTKTTSLTPRLVATVDGTCLVKKELADKWDKTAEEVIEASRKNSEGFKPGVVTEMFSKLMEMHPDDELLEAIENLEVLAPDERQYVISNTEDTLGAAAITYKPVQAELEKIFGKRFAIIPSSKHEVIVLAVPDDVEALRRAIMDTNATEVSARDFLCNNPWIYDDGIITEV